jgi:hypothetical protein
MLQAFFEDVQPSCRHLFDGLAVASNKKIMEHQGCYPVIHLTFKDIKGRDLESNLEAIKLQISEEFRRHANIRSALGEYETEEFDAIAKGTASSVEFEQSLRRLSDYLYRYSGRRVIALLDEYDMPLHAAEEHGYRDQLMPFMRNLLSGLLKDNDSRLEKGILTGILRVAKESIFSGLNNLTVYSLLGTRFVDKFGLTEDDVRLALQTYGQTDKLEDVRKWYNGYRIGGLEITNPWSMIHFLHEGRLGDYWINTSDNALIRDLVAEHGDADMERDVAQLLMGGTITCDVQENITFQDLPSNRDALWSFLFFTGYLTLAAEDEKSATFGRTLCIPNMEVRSFFKKLFVLTNRVPNSRTQAKLVREALLGADIGSLEHGLRELTAGVLSYHDLGGEAERVYHAFVLGLLLMLEDDFEVTSNRESGSGRYDIMLAPRRSGQPGFIIEIKQTGKQDADTLLAVALEQIDQRDYAQQLRQREAMPMFGIAMVFRQKKVWVKARRI